MKYGLVFLFFILIFIKSVLAFANAQSGAGVCSHDCTIKKVSNLKSIPRSDLGIGMKRVLIHLYGTCAVKDPLNGKGLYVENLTHDNFTLVGPGVPLGDGDRYIKGIPKSFSNLRGVDKRIHPLGPYQSVAKGAKACTNKVKVKGEELELSKVHKIFGYGAGGRLIDGEFNIFSCGAKGFHSNIKKKDLPLRKALDCGLDADSLPAITLDCAEFIGAGAIASCKKLHHEQTFSKKKKFGPKGQILLGKSFLSTGSLTDRKNECLKQPLISPANPISNGDIFVMGGHSIVITDVEEDPFGILGTLQDKKECHSITSDDLNFSFAHSSSSRELGPIQTTAKSYSNLMIESGYFETDERGLKNVFPLDSIVLIARKLCEDTKRGKLKPAPSKQSIQDPKVRQLRHQSDNKKCFYKKGECPKSVGSECSKMCEKEN